MPVYTLSSEFANGNSLLTLPLLAFRLLDVTTRGTLDNTWHMRTAKEQYGALTTLSAFVRAWSHQCSPLGFECSVTKRRWGDALRAWEATLVLHWYNDLNT